MVYGPNIESGLRFKNNNFSEIEIFIDSNIILPGQVEWIPTTQLKQAKLKLMEHIGYIWVD